MQEADILPNGLNVAGSVIMDSTPAGQAGLIGAGGFGEVRTGRLKVKGEEVGISIEAS